MKCSCLVIIVTWLSASVANGSVVPKDSEVLLKSDGNNVELYKDSGNGSSWLQMVLVFAHHSSNNQSKTIIPDERPEDTTTSPTSTEAPIVCKEGFVQLESKKCYFFSSRREKWQDALKTCQAMGTTLAYPLNANENTILVNYFKNFKGISSWLLGGSDEVKEGQWVWAHSKSPIVYGDWSVGEPNNFLGKENCLDLKFSEPDWKWNDIPCDESYNYICQQ